MKPVVLAALSSALLLVAPAAPSAQTRFFLGGGPTGTSAFGFRGGWGGALGLDHRIGDGGSFLLRAEAGAVPSTPGQSRYYYAQGSDLGLSGPRSRDAAVANLMAGLRLGGAGNSGPYLDALVGVGYLNDPTNPEYTFRSGSGTSGSHANIALSVGPGVAVHPPYGPAWFAEIHYDFYFVDDASTPMIPVRFGLVVP